MSTILIQIKDKAELDFLSALLMKMNIKSEILSENELEELEDRGMVKMLKKVDRTKKANKLDVLNMLRQASQKNKNEL